MRIKPVFLFLLFALGITGVPAQTALVLPEDFVSPAGFVVDERPSKTYDFDHQPITYQKAGSGQAEHLDLAGRTWRIFLKVAPQNRSADATDVVMRASLKAQGWELLTPSGLLVARRTGGGKECWFSGTAEAGYYRAVIVEVGAVPHSLALPAPAAVAETVGDADDFPYLGRFPGATFLRTDARSDETLDASSPGVQERTIVGPPLVTKRYQLPVSTSPYEYMVVYRDALAKAGWEVVRAAAGGDVVVIAHYARNGRDLYCYLHGDFVKVADVGAQNEARKLADALAKEGHIAIHGIYFDVDKATLKSESETALRHVLELLQKDPALALEVQGHTDDTGETDRNEKLSEDRAATVKTWLVAHGAGEARLSPKGFGATRPVADDKTPEGRARNRRVELAKK